MLGKVLTQKGRAQKMAVNYEVTNVSLPVISVTKGNDVSVFKMAQLQNHGMFDTAASVPCRCSRALCVFFRSLNDGAEQTRRSGTRC